MPGDQGRDDAGSLCFESKPLTGNLEILGAPRVILEMASNQPLGQIAVRLNDVAPEGASARVSYGLLNLTHREGHRQPLLLRLNRPCRVEVPLSDIAYAFPAGHRLRLALFTGNWPIARPSPPCRRP
jgi:putative CocE/NonD family hydrolase